MTAVGGKGSIIGSEINAGISIVCARAGNEAKVPTSLNIVFPDDEDNNESTLKKYKNKADKDLDTFIQTREKFKERYSAEERNNNKFFIKLENSIYKKNLEIKELEEKIRKLEEFNIKKSKSSISVTEKLYACVTFSIDKYQHPSSEINGPVAVKLVNDKIKLAAE